MFTVNVPSSLMENTWKVLNSPAVEISATLFTILYPITVLYTLRQALSTHEFRHFRRGAELGCLSCIFLQQFAVLIACLVEYETRLQSLGSILFSPAIVPCLSMLVLGLITMPLAVRTHCSMKLSWIGALCACLIQQGLWMAYSLVMWLTTKKEERSIVHFGNAADHVSGHDGTISHILAVMALGILPIAVLRSGCCDGSASLTDDDNEVEKDDEIMAYHELA